jgi:hypothetical protein
MNLVGRPSRPTIPGHGAAGGPREKRARRRIAGGFFDKPPSSFPQLAVSSHRQITSHPPLKSQPQNLLETSRDFPCGCGWARGPAHSLGLGAWGHGYLDPERCTDPQATEEARTGLAAAPTVCVIAR